MKLDSNQQAFFELVRAGLWERETHISTLGCFDYSKVYQFAEEQSSVGLVAAGLEHVHDVKVPQDISLAFVGSTLQLEQRNIAMNEFVAKLIAFLRENDVYALLVKGQGIAQCYERPLWRACGDVDLLLSDSNYRNAVKLLSAKASSVEEEIKYKLHSAMTLDSWDVDLHGTLRSGLWKSIDSALDQVQFDLFCGGNVQSWMDGDTQVFIPRADENVVFIFSHIVQHFFRGGIGIRQICDWCRLLWTYHSKLDLSLLEKRLKQMNVMSEWKAFAALAVGYLGMPVEAMPFYASDRKWERKAGCVLSYILETGNFGHNRDYSYLKNNPIFARKTITFYRQAKDSLRLVPIFPKDAIISLMHFGWRGVGDLLKG